MEPLGALLQASCVQWGEESNMVGTEPDWLVKQNIELIATNTCRLSCWFSVGLVGLENLSFTVHIQISLIGPLPCVYLCVDIRWAYYLWLLHRVDQECSKIPSGQSAQHLQTHLDSVFMVCTYTHVFSTSVLLTIICILHFLEQWIVNPSNMDLIFGSIILVWLCCSYNTLFKLLEENIDTFVKNELKKSQRVLR